MYCVVEGEEARSILKTRDKRWQGREVKGVLLGLFFFVYFSRQRLGFALALALSLSGSTCLPLWLLFPLVVAPDCFWDLLLLVMAMDSEPLAFLPLLSTEMARDRQTDTEGEYACDTLFPILLLTASKPATFDSLG